MASREGCGCGGILLIVLVGGVIAASIDNFSWESMLPIWDWLSSYLLMCCGLPLLVGTLIFGLIYT